MRPQALLVGLIAMSLGGCVTGQSVQPRALLDTFRSLRAPAAGQVHLDVALIEGPIGDRYLNDELWGLADDQVVHLEQKAALEDNGFRVAQTGGITPAGLQERLSSDQSCVNPRRLVQHAGKPITVLVGAPAAEARFQIHEEGSTTPVRLTDAQYALIVVPAITAEGKLHLRFSPEIQTGKAQAFYQPAADRSGWLFQEQQPAVHYNKLAWEVTLAPNEYVIVGGRFDQTDTLGHQCFIRRDEPAPKQRLLVIRAGAVTPTPSADDGTLAAAEQTSHSFPLALQAAYASAR